MMFCLKIKVKFLKSLIMDKRKWKILYVLFKYYLYKFNLEIPFIYFITNRAHTGRALFIVYKPAGQSFFGNRIFLTKIFFENGFTK